MNALITLRAEDASGKPLQAIFSPERGMALLSFKRGSVEALALSTAPAFEERYAGLGPLIGPHFYRRNSNVLPMIPHTSLFPHIARVKAKGIQDPFSHGIARYAPWKAEYSENSFQATLKGEDLWNNTPLKSLEGQDFNITFTGKLRKEGLFLSLSIVSGTDSLMGIHYYYSLPGSRGRVVARVQPEARFERKLSAIPPHWPLDTQNYLHLEIDEDIDVTFRPYPDLTHGEILLNTETYSLRTRYSAPSAENSWQLYHPKGHPFVCIEPLSASDPCHPHLSVSSLNIHLELGDP